MNAELLSIDVEAELKKLTLGRLRNPHQVAVPLVRLCAALGASTVTVQLTRSLLRLEHDGHTIPPESVQALQILFDRSRDELARHGALEQLETQGLLDLLTAFAMGGGRVELDLGAPASCRILVRLHDGSPLWLRVLPTSRSFGMALQVHDCRQDPQLATGELIEALRFASMAVEVNGKRIDGGLRLPDTILELLSVQRPFKLVIGLPREGLAGLTRFLERGVLCNTLWESHPDGMVWEAVVDGPLGQPPGWTTEVLPLVRRAAASLYQTARERFAELNPRDQKRIQQLLFRLADHGLGAPAVAGARLFKTERGEWVDCDYLRTTSRGRIVRAVGSKARLERFDLSGDILVLDEQERGFIERHLGLVVREPPRLPRKGGLGSLIRYLERTGHLLRKALRLMTRRREIAADQLMPEEARFLGELNRIARAGDFLGGQVRRLAFVRGRLVAFRQVADGRILMGRYNPSIRRMVAAHQNDPRTLAATLLLLGDGQTPFTAGCDQLSSLAFARVKASPN